MSGEIRRGSDRFAERVQGRLSRHGFSFGQHYDPERLSFGPMVCHDDHLLGSGTGFEDHPHENLEIVTWVVSGTLVHTDDTGATTTLRAGDCGVLSTGDGVRHSEIAGEGPTRFVQVWLTPDADSAATASPQHSVASLDALAVPGAGPVRVVGDGGPLAVAVHGAALDVARLGAGETLTLPDAARVHAFLTTGSLSRSSLAEPLGAGDTLCLTADAVDPDGPGAVTAATVTTTAVTVTAAVPTEILVWSFA